MTLYLYQIAEKASHQDGAIAVIAHSEQNAQEQIAQRIQTDYPHSRAKFYVQEPTKKYADKKGFPSEFPWVLKERFAIAGYLAQRIVLFAYHEG